MSVPRYFIKTFGCKANTYDSVAIEQRLQDKGFSPQQSIQDPVDICIINSCTVTQEAERQAKQWIEKLSQKYPQAKIILTGCAAEVNSHYFKSSSVDCIVPNHHKEKLTDFLCNHSNPVHASATTSWPVLIQDFSPRNRSEQTFKTRKFLKIQEGCRSFCTYCIIPYARGPHRSLEMKTLLKQIQQCVDLGMSEIVLTGTNIGDYGIDLDPACCLDDLVENILSQTDIKRIRLSSLNPREISMRLLSYMQQTERLCPHLHISLQSPHPRILRAMKRNYRFQAVEECLQRIQQTLAAKGRKIFVGMDLITGFPSETEEEFHWTWETLNRLPWQRLHVFPFSARKSTAAIKIQPQVPGPIRINRAQTFLKLSLERLTQFYQSFLEPKDQVIDQVLIERSHELTGEIAGYSPHYLRIVLPSSTFIQPNQMITVRPLSLKIDPKNQEVALISEYLQNKTS